MDKNFTKMKTLKHLLTALLVIFISSSWAQNSVIHQLAVIDSNAMNIYMGHQSLIDHDGTFYLFYSKLNADVDYLIMRSSNDNGATWSEPDTLSSYNHGTTYSRYHMIAPQATFDESGNIHVLYEYRGAPVYNTSWTAYPPSHLNYATNSSGSWVVEVDLINDSLIQTRQGNGNTVSYLNDNQIINYRNHQHSISYDYAWWATKYNIVYSNNISGEWLPGDTLHTYNLGDYDNIILQAPAMVVNNDSLFALWYQRKDCRVEMKTFAGSDWSPLSVVYNDVVYPAPHPTSYNVRVGSCFNNDEARIAMFRTPEADFNELLLLTKNKGHAWATDTLMLSKTYSIVKPSMVQDTTYVFLIWDTDTENGSTLVKYTNDFVSQTKLITDDGVEKIYNIEMFDQAVNPLIYLVYDQDKSKYFLKTGEINGISTAVHSMIDAHSELTLMQNQPNPFNDATKISYTIDQPCVVRLEVYNMLGERIQTLVNKYQYSGSYTVDFKGNDLNQGIYFYKLNALGHSVTQKMMVVH